MPSMAESQNRCAAPCPEDEILWRNLYTGQWPDFLARAAQTPCMQRLKQVGMNCGCEYTAFPRFRRQGGYTRYLHSVGVGAIVWHFTGDPAASLAGLLHDAATPVFAHVVDFLHGDYMAQESTEAGTAHILAGDTALGQILEECRLRVEDVADYHRWPIADNPTPQLSADRLEYSLGNMVRYGVADFSAAARYYGDIAVARNEKGEEELCFLHADTALSFARDALRCSEIYVSPEDRYAMQMLSELLGCGLRDGLVTPRDLWGTEPRIIAKWLAEPDYSRRWQTFCALNAMESAAEKGEGDGWRQIPAKKRCIDPYVAGQGRVSALDRDFAAALQEFLHRPQDQWLRGGKNEKNWENS